MGVLLRFWHDPPQALTLSILFQNQVLFALMHGEEMTRSLDKPTRLTSHLQRGTGHMTPSPRRGAPGRVLASLGLKDLDPSAASYVGPSRVTASDPTAAGVTCCG
jgi:hypothetical protein